MITEDYVSFESAKLLKEKGFNPIDCGMYYSITTGKRTTEMLTSLVACPTLQMAMKWLREIHNISIEVVYDCSNDKPKTISWWLAYIKHINSDYSKGSDCLTAYDSYEEAADDAIKYVLENWI